jgi:hypothetical protein
MVSETVCASTSTSLCPTVVLSRMQAHALVWELCLRLPSSCAAAASARDAGNRPTAGDRSAHGPCHRPRERASSPRAEPPVRLRDCSAGPHHGVCRCVMSAHTRVLVGIAFCVSAVMAWSQLSLSCDRVGQILVTTEGGVILEYCLPASEVVPAVRVISLSLCLSPSLPPHPSSTLRLLPYPLFAALPRSSPPPPPPTTCLVVSCPSKRRCAVPWCRVSLRFQGLVVQPMAGIEGYSLNASYSGLHYQWDNSGRPSRLCAVRLL